jgi:hypothetical protein
MKYPFLILIVLFFLLAFEGTTNYSLAEGGTNVSGIITSDTTWTKMDSPYNFVAPVSVNMGVTLTIEPGATINIKDYYLSINGNLRCIGTTDDPIHINSTSARYGPEIQFTQYSPSWDSQSSSGSIIQNSIISLNYGVKVNSTSPRVDNNRIIGCISLSQSSSIITRNIINSTVYEALSGIGSPIIWNNTITGEGIYVQEDSNIYGQTILPQIVGNVIISQSNAYGIYASSAYISDNTISGYKKAGIQIGGSAIIQKNLLTNNQVGIKVVNAEQGIKNNTIKNNVIGIDGTTLINFNNIANNSQYNLYMWSLYNTTATMNWWGTTDIQTINQTIFDNKNNFNLGTVTFLPLLPELNLQAIPDPNVPMPTLIVPIATPTPTSLPITSSSPTSNPSIVVPTPTNSASQSTPEKSASNPSKPLVSITLIIVIITVAVLLIVSLGLSYKKGTRLKQKTARLLVRKDGFAKK